MRSSTHPATVLQRLILGTLACLGLALFGQAQEAEQRTEPWSPEVVELFGSLPIQHGGRVKPLQKFAGLNLLVLNGKRKFKDDEGNTIKQTEWLLDCYFYPELAKTYQCFRVQNDDVLAAVGMDTKSNDKRKSDRYSYNELSPFKMALMEKAMRISGIEPKDRDPIESQSLKLAGDLRKFESLIGTLEPARWTCKTADSQELNDLFGAPTATLSTVLGKTSELMRLWRKADQEGGTGSQDLKDILSQLDYILESNQDGIALMPPPTEFEDQETWWRVYDLVRLSFETNADTTLLLPVLAGLEKMEATKGDPAAFLSALEGLGTTTTGLATARGQYASIPREVMLENADPFTMALVLFLLAFLAIAFSWLAPRNHLIVYGAWVLCLAALGLGTWGIVMRCVIRWRPPVVSLYDTIIFVTCSCVAVALVAEWLTRRRAALSVAAFLGLLGMFLAGKYEFKEVSSSGDTMASVVAVLDTNYYLAIHVTAITLGYAGGLLAGGIAHIWILGKLFRIKKNDKAFYKTVTRMTYGVLCFSLLFSIFGTIMGGVWANDSWGRFWGWDPKENGALLICIWSLLILHMRMGGYIRDRGFAVMTVIGGGIIAASWFGVNLLGVGLHSYGFTNGIFISLLSFWIIEGVVVLLSGVDTLLRRGATS